MMFRQRGVAVTGIGIVAPTGIGKERFWSAVVSGPPAIGPISRFDSTSYTTQIAAEVRDESYRELVPTGKLRTTTRATQYALAATELALRDSGSALATSEPFRRGVVLGTSVGGWHEAQQQYAVLLEKGAGRVNPFLANGGANHASAVEVAQLVQAKGSHATLSTGCCGSTHAIGYAADLIAFDQLDFCITGGTEAPITPLVVSALGRLKELSEANDVPLTASRPFECTHNGFVLGEGSAILVLEATEKARARGAAIYAEILGHASGADAADPYRVDLSGEAGAMAILACMRRSGIKPEHVDYISANANSSPHLDRKEVIVLKRALGSRVFEIPVSSIKAIIGHPFGASGAFQTAATCLAIERGIIPPTHNILTPDPECDLDLVPNFPRSAAIRSALVCSYGFGGLNAYLALSAPGFAASGEETAR
jgi:3-oxoacyl-[acyl-carrier-protein] synthase II